MISNMVAAYRMKHCEARLKERELDLDIEYCLYLAQKFNEVDTAIVLGEKSWLGDLCRAILICRDGFPATIEYRRKSQSLNNKVLGVEKIEWMSLKI